MKENSEGTNSEGKFARKPSRLSSKEKTFCEKYRPSCFIDIQGQEAGVLRIKEFIDNFKSNKKNAMLLHGPAGTGKTSLAHVLAKETGSEIIELNASDLRNKDQIDKIVRTATQQKSLFNSSKIILVDEVDGISVVDRGGLPELIKIIQDSFFPVIITANDIWDSKFSSLRQKCELVQFKDVNYLTILKILTDVASTEGLDIDPDMLKSISIKSKGDIRAALNDLQSSVELTTEENISERDKTTSIFNALQKVFKNMPNNETKNVYNSVDEPLDKILLWVEENIPNEYQGEELKKAYDAVSKADVFRGRIYRQQHWRFLVYQNLFLSVGISAAKKTNKLGFTKYEPPKRILKIWMMNQKIAKKKTIAEKYAKYVHIGKKRALREFSIIKNFIKDQDIQKQLKLTEEEVEYLTTQ
ncbi:MAG: replication factor C large subunit [Nanoarchaeota archaeon]|nr:replication factor C large subunit [Nanoarchaeota archaeon]